MRTLCKSGALCGVIVVLFGGALTTAGRQTPAAPRLSIEQRVDGVIRQQMAIRHIPGLSLGVVRDGQLRAGQGVR